MKWKVPRKIADLKKSSYNWIWTDPQPYSNITAITSEDCSGLDSS